LPRDNPTCLCLHQTQRDPEAHIVTPKFVHLVLSLPQSYLFSPTEVPVILWEFERERYALVYTCLAVAYSGLV
jgi:hypothetical protein